MLQELHLKHVGPAPQVDIEFGGRLNIFTGDNGLGKTFLLDIAWWTLTHSWANNPILPQRNATQKSEIKYKTAQLEQPKKSHFDFANHGN